MKKYKIKLVNYYAFGDEVAVVEAESQKEAIDLAVDLYPDAEGYVIIDIYEKATSKI